MTSSNGVRHANQFRTPKKTRAGDRRGGGGTVAIHIFFRPQRARPCRPVGEGDSSAKWADRGSWSICFTIRTSRMGSVIALVASLPLHLVHHPRKADGVSTVVHNNEVGSLAGEHLHASAAASFLAVLNTRARWNSDLRVIGRFEQQIGNAAEDRFVRVLFHFSQSLPVGITPELFPILFQLLFALERQHVGQIRHRASQSGPHRRTPDEVRRGGRCRFHPHR